jgi:WD40 repeat protein
MSLVQYDSHGRPIVNTATTGAPLEHLGIVTFAVDDTKLVAGCADNAVRIWDLRMQRMVNELREHSHWVTSVQFDARKLVSTSRDRTIRIWDVDGTLGSYLHSSIGSMKGLPGTASSATAAGSPTTTTTTTATTGTGSRPSPPGGAAQMAE